MAAAMVETAVGAAKQGDPLRVIPIRKTTGDGVPENVDVKEGLRHIVKHVTIAATGDWYDLGRPVRSAAIVAEGATVVNVTWDPDSATGRITVSASGAGTAWLHIWSRD